MMRMRRYLAVFTAALMMASGYAAATTSADEQRLRELDKQWSQAAGAKDAAKTASFYAEDGAMLPPNAPIVNGKAKIQETWAGLMAKPGFAIHFEPTRIVVAKSGDVAFDVGTFGLTMNDAQGKPTTAVGKYVVAWSRKKNGEWKVEADCFNTDQ